MSEKEKVTVKKIQQLKVERTKLTNLKTHPTNARHGDVGMIVESLETHGQFRPLVVQKNTGHVLAGNHTLAAMRVLNWEEADVTYVDVDEDQALRILLIDNRANDLATYDEQTLLQLLQKLAPVSLDGTGYDGDDLDDLLFKLEGNDGFMVEALSAPERFASYEAAGIRSIILHYPDGEYNELFEKLKVVRERANVESNSELFAKFVREASENN